MQQKLQQIEATINGKLAEKRVLSSQISEIDSEIKKLSSTTLSFQKAASFCDLLIEKMNAASVEDIEKLVTEALQFIFERPYKFKMNPEVKRGSMTYTFSLEIDGREIDNIMDSEGGGIVSVISILMRIITILISDPPMQRVLILDESLAQLSEEYIDNASKFIKDLGKKLGFCIVLVTHQQAFRACADVIYEVDKGEVRTLK